MTRIQQQKDSLVRQAKKIIVWIHLAERPLTIDELLCSLAVRDGDTSFDPTGIPIRKTLLNCCLGLVVVDQETSTVRLVHYSLDEHLQDQNKIFGHTKAQWHSKIARTCLTFLKFPPVIDREALEQSGIVTTILLYAATQWGHHLRRSEDLPDAPLGLAKEYFNTSFQENPLSLRLLGRAMYRYNYKEWLLADISPVHIMAFFGISKIIFDPMPIVWYIDSKDGYGQTPLSWAAMEGHEAVVKLLVENGAAVDSPDDYGLTPLSRAAMDGHEAVVKLLVEHGAVIDSADNSGQPLVMGCEGGTRGSGEAADF